MENIVYDIAGIGIGPFNLGLAALAEPINKLNCIFFDAKSSFSWHPGLMLHFAKLQVPFYADLVTGADPSSKFSFLNYMKRTGRLYQFAILEDNYITRKEYNDYCFWVVSQLPSLRFGHKVIAIKYDEIEGCYLIETLSDGISKRFRAMRVVVGTGSVPFIPEIVPHKHDKNMVHSSQYLLNRDMLIEKKHVIVVGSGQSAAEIFYDLLSDDRISIKQLDWITRSERLFPMDVSKFSLEMASPDYINYFHGLTRSQKGRILQQQDHLYKGINQELLSDIYRLLYRGLGGPTEIKVRTNCELKKLESIGNGFKMSFHHNESGRDFFQTAEAIILATGYHRPIPTFIEGVRDRLNWEANGNYNVAKNYSVDKKGNKFFLQNADLHSHGFNAPDLGMGTYRNAIILNTVLGYDHFLVETKIAFQVFGV